MSPVIQGRLFRELVSLDGIETKRHYCKFWNMFVKLGPVFFDCVFLMVWKEFSAKGRARRHQSGFLVPICGTCYGSLIRWVYEDAFIIFEIIRWLETFTWGWIASGINLIDQLGQNLLGILGGKRWGSCVAAIQVRLVIPRRESRFAFYYSHDIYVWHKFNYKNLISCMIKIDSLHVSSDVHWQFFNKWNYCRITF